MSEDEEADQRARQSTAKASFAHVAGGTAPHRVSNGGFTPLAVALSIAVEPMA